MADENRESESFFLPDLCNVRAVFLVVITMQLLAFVLVLADSSYRNFWTQLGLISLFIQWIALTGSGLLCLARHQLTRLPIVWAGAASFLILLGVCLLLSEMAYWVVVYSKLDTFAVSWSHGRFLLRNTAIAAIISALTLRYLYVQHQWRRNVRNEAELRIQALQARMRPHFLFNSMNTIAALIRSQPQTAEQAVEDLADLFRISLSDARHQIRLDEELDICQQYARIESLRLGERLRIEWKLDGLPLDALVPSLCLQPLLENAIYHGIEGLPDGGTIHITGSLEHGLIKLTLENPLPQRRNTQRRGNKIALENTRQRLLLAYGEQGVLRKEIGADHYRVYLQFPYQRAAQTSGFDRTRGMV